MRYFTVVRYFADDGLSNSIVSNDGQLVTLAEAGRMLEPLVAREVERETRKIEIRLQVHFPVLGGFGSVRFEPRVTFVSLCLPREKVIDAFLVC